jgi:hypothetical protein
MQLLGERATISALLTMGFSHARQFLSGLMRRSANQAKLRACPGSSILSASIIRAGFECQVSGVTLHLSGLRWRGGLEGVRAAEPSKLSESEIFWRCFAHGSISVGVWPRDVTIS